MIFLFRGGKLEVPQEPGPGAVPPRSQGSPPRGMEDPDLNISWGEKKKRGVREQEREDLFIFPLISEPCYVLLLCKQEVWKASFPPVPVQGQLGT